jgi:hypothetical protein
MAASARRLSADGFTPLPQYTWDTVLSDVSEEIKGPFKFCLENNGTRALGASPFSGVYLRITKVGSNDGYLYYETAPDDNGTISKPWGVTVVAEGSGGSFVADSEYGWKVTAVNGSGETIGSAEVTLTPTGTDKARLDWTTVPDATSYKVYRTAAGGAGTYGATSLRATVSAPTVTYLDDGAALSSGTPPEENTTGGAGPDYGTAPDAGDFDDSDKLIGTLDIEEQYFYWARLVVPPGTTEQSAIPGGTGNRRTLRIAPKEV